MGAQRVDRARISSWLEALDERPDELHVDITPAVLALIDSGLDGIEGVLDRLNAPGRLTRKRAQRVLEGGLARHLGWVPDVGHPTPDGAARTQAITEANAYDADADESSRLAAIGRWRQWLASERAQGKEPR